MSTFFCQCEIVPKKLCYTITGLNECSIGICIFQYWTGPGIKDPIPYSYQAPMNRNLGLTSKGVYSYLSMKQGSLFVLFSTYEIH